jgi:hypothetical protein
MRALFIVGVGVLVALSALGTALLVGTQLADESWIAALMIPAATMSGTPLLVAAILNASDADSPLKPHAHRRLWWFVIAVEVLCAAAVIAITMLARGPWWLPAALIVLSAVCGLVLLIAPALRRHGARTPSVELGAEPDYTRSMLRRDRALIAIWTCGTLAVALAAVVAVAVVLPEHPLPLVLVALALALLAGSTVCVRINMRLGRRLRVIAGDDPGRIRALNDVVVKAKDTPLAPRDRAVAPRYARTALIAHGYAYTFIVALFSALALIQLSNLSTTRMLPLHIALLAFFAIGLVTATILMFRENRRIRAYIHANAP